MKEVKIYIANDGTQFDNEDACLNYEYNGKKTDFINRQLGKRPKINTAIKHNINIKILWQKFLLLCIADSDYTVASFAKDIYNSKRHRSHLGHYLQRSNNSLYDLYIRFECIDFFSGIEYDQPYYVSHPDEFKGQIINFITN